MTKRAQSFRFVDVPSAPVPSLLRGFSAPVNLSINLNDRDLEFLMANDSDGFNRWQAANSYATRILVDMVKALKKGERSTARGTAYAKALGAAIANESLEPAYNAELLKLPSQSDVAREIGRNVDPGLIFRAHRSLSKIIGTVLGDELAAIYRTMKPEAAFSPDAKSAGRRALRNACLTLLTARGTDADAARLSQHFFKASNMTDEAHALVLIAAGRSADREKAIQRFHDRWKGDHLVIDIWFAAQAQSPQPGTLKTLRQLVKHPLFQITTPNKVRALIGNFALLNPVQFHRPDGAGYEFVASHVLQIDRSTPRLHRECWGRSAPGRASRQGGERQPNACCRASPKAPSFPGMSMKS